MAHGRRRAAALALLAAAFYALNAPVAKLLLSAVAPTMMAALLYLGAGLGMGALGLLRGRAPEGFVGKRRYAAGMVLLDIAAPICLMMGLRTASAAHAALLNNFELAATAVIARAVFAEPISRRLWRAIALVTAACAILSFEDLSSLTFSGGSLLILLASLCWGLENNCTRMLSSGDPLRIVVVKGLGAGLGSLGIALAAGEPLPPAGAALAALALGFVSYGLSILCYVRAQRDLGAAKTGAYYAAAPFLSALLAVALFRQLPSGAFFAALPVMAAGVALTAADSCRSEVREG